MSNWARYFTEADDLIPSVVTVSGSAEDTGYPASSLILPYGSTNRPAKLTTTTGWWKFIFAGPVSPLYAMLTYHNWDAGRAVFLQGNSVDNFAAPPFQQAFVIPTHHADGWPVNSLLTLTGAPSYRYWLLISEEANSLTLDLRRLHLFSAIHEMPADVRFGVSFRETHRDIAHETGLGLETVYDLGGKEREIDGELPSVGAGAETFQEIRRAVHGRVFPWVFVPDFRVNDPWWVRFTEPTGSYVHEDANYYPQRFAIREVARGLPWP